MTKRERHAVAMQAARMMRGIPCPRNARYAQAYLAMAEHANYRPAAPGDGCGHVYLSEDECRDPQRLAEETVKYVKTFEAEEDDLRFTIGCSNFTTNRALIWAIEACRNLCGGQDTVALTLLKMAGQEVESESKEIKRSKASQ